MTKAKLSHNDVAMRYMHVSVFAQKRERERVCLVCMCVSVLPDACASPPISTFRTCSDAPKLGWNRDSSSFRLINFAFGAWPSGLQLACWLRSQIRAPAVAASQLLVLACCSRNVHCNIEAAVCEQLTVVDCCCPSKNLYLIFSNCTEPQNTFICSWELGEALSRVTFCNSMHKDAAIFVHLCCY